MAVWILRALRELTGIREGKGQKAVSRGPRIPHCLIGAQGIQTYSIKIRPACVSVCV